MKTIAILLMICLCYGCFAETCYANDPAHKLARGLANLLTGWVEIPKQIFVTSVETNVFYGLTIGVVKGIAMAIVRTGAGIYEILTFPFPIPENFEPVLKPEFVFND